MNPHWHLKHPPLCVNTREYTDPYVNTTQAHIDTCVYTDTHTPGPSPTRPGLLLTVTVSFMPFLLQSPVRGRAKRGREVRDQGWGLGKFMPTAESDKLRPETATATRPGSILL